MEDLVDTLELNFVTIHNYRVFSSGISDEAKREHIRSELGRSQRFQLVSVFLILIDLFQETDFNLASVLISCDKDLRELQVLESCSDSKTDIVQLM